jgi:hypothetical protein
MPYPTIELESKKVIILSGFERTQADEKPVEVKDKSKLEAAAKKHGDAVAFAYFSGRWIPAA